MIVSKYGVSFNSGKSFMTWIQYIEVLRLFATEKLVNTVVNEMNNVTEYSTMDFQHEQDLQRIEDIAASLGIKPTKTLEGTKTRIKKYLTTNSKSSDESITHRI